MIKQLPHLYQKHLYAICIFCTVFFSTQGLAQTTFSDGDIAFTRYVSDNENFSFVFLVNVAASTEFFITDEGWNGSGFYSNESTIRFVVNSAISAGDVCHVSATALTYTMNSGGSPMTISSVGTFNPNLGNMLGSFGDNLFVYQNSPSFNVIAGLSADNGVSGSSGNAWFAAAASSTNGSVIPSGQTNASDGFIGLFPNGLNSEVDNARYKETATFSGDKASILADLMDYTKWDFNNSTLYAASSTSFTVSGGASPVSISITASSNVSCNGGTDGSVTATATPGDPNYSYIWSNGSSTSNTSSTTNTINNLAAGTYTVTVTDDNGTTATTSTTIMQPSATIASASVTSALDCNGDTDGQVTASPSGGTSPYTYSWNTGETNATETNLGAGTYSVTITDQNGCTDSASVTLTQPAAMVASASVSSALNCNGDTDGQVTASPSGGTGPYTYSWNTGETNATETSLGAGTYSVTITDQNGCTDSASVSLTQPAAISGGTIQTN